jgi:hypothetical protein
MLEIGRISWTTSFVRWTSFLIREFLLFLSRVSSRIVSETDGGVFLMLKLSKDWEMELLLFKLLLLNINGFLPSVFHPLIFTYICWNYKQQWEECSDLPIRYIAVNWRLDWITLAFRICHCTRDEENLIALALAMLARTDWEIWKHTSSITGAVWSCGKEW